MATKLFINGEWVAATGGSIPTYNPATEEVIDEVGSASAADVDAAVAAARAALSKAEWAGLLPIQRAALLFKAAELIEKYADELAALETKDQGQLYGIARHVSVQGAAEHFRYYAGWVTKMEGFINPVSFPDTMQYSTREPIGVNALVTPWNFPLLIASWKLAPALATGNTVIIKPSEVTPLSTLRLIEILHEAGFPEGVVNIVTGDGAVGAMLGSHMGIDHLSFTGSTGVGRALAHLSADSNMKRLTLELGGKAPSIIAADADIDAAVGGNVMGGFLNGGQVCAAYTRFYVDKKRESEFVEKLAGAASSMKLGSGMEETTQMGPLVSEKHIGYVERLVETGKAQGAELITGGARATDKGYFFQPTVFAGVRDDMNIAQDEIFGPVLSVMSYDGTDELDDIIRRANDTQYGLAATIWTKDIKTAQRLSQGIKAGAVFVNMPPIPDMAAPWGGYKASGWGREMGRLALDAYTEVKSVWMNYGY